MTAPRSQGCTEPTHASSESVPSKESEEPVTKRLDASAPAATPGTLALNELFFVFQSACVRQCSQLTSFGTYHAYFTFLLL